jgi:hypothetical protein
MLTPVQRHLCEEWRALLRAAAERTEEISRVERHLGALQQAHRRLLAEAEALGAYLQLCHVSEPSAQLYGGPSEASDAQAP